MTTEKFYVFLNWSLGQKNIVAFRAFEPDDGLPFPLNLTSTKLFLSFTLVLTLVFGFRVRCLIFKYLKTIDFKVGNLLRLLKSD